ncbi:MAG: hypothetical protein IT304_08955, partial [Dehalococcoidia bacterium]|nr:hypothetical protein [Dehalococcoidia bacterium]
MRALILALTLALLAPLSAAATPFKTLPAAIPHIATYYADMARLSGLAYHDPQVKIVTDDPETFYDGECGVATDLFLAFYCPLDETIVLEADELDNLAEVDEF